MLQINIQNIDARGSRDPAETRREVERGVRAVVVQEMSSAGIVRDSVKRATDRPV